MKKLMVMAAMLALILAAAAPAFASHAVGGDVNIDVVDASQTQTTAATQTNEGDAEASGLGSAADASIDQSLTVDQSQVNSGWSGVAAGWDIWRW